MADDVASYNDIDLDRAFQWTLCPRLPQCGVLILPGREHMPLVGRVSLVQDAWTTFPIARLSNIDKTRATAPVPVWTWNMLSDIVSTCIHFIPMIKHHRLSYVLHYGWSSSQLNRILISPAAAGRRSTADALCVLFLLWLFCWLQKWGVRKHHVKEEHLGFGGLFLFFLGHSLVHAGDTQHWASPLFW